MQNIFGDCISAARNMRLSSLQQLAAVHVPRLERLQLSLVFLEVLGFVTTLQDTHLLALRVVSAALYMLCALCYHWLSHTLRVVTTSHDAVTQLSHTLTLTTTYSPLVEVQHTHTPAAPRPAHSTHAHNHTALTPSHSPHNTHSQHNTHTTHNSHNLPPFSLCASPTHKAMTLSLGGTLSLYVFNMLTVALGLWMRDPWALFEILSLCVQAAALSVLFTVRERLRDGDVILTHSTTHTQTHISSEPSLRRSVDRTAAAAEEEAKHVSESADNRKSFHSESSV